MSSRREEVAQRKPFKRVFSGLFRKQKGCGPFDILWVPDLQCLTSRAPPTYYGSTLFPVCTALLVCKMSDDLPAEQQIWKTCPPQGIFALQKSLRGGLQWGTGDLIAENAAPRKEIFRENLLCAELGLPSLSYPSTREYSKVREHARFVTLSVPGSSGCQRGRRPSVWEGVQRKPVQGFPLGNFFLTADAVLLCAAKKNSDSRWRLCRLTDMGCRAGVGTTRLAGFCQFSPDPWVTHSSKKPHTVGSGK